MNDVRVEPPGHSASVSALVKSTIIALVVAALVLSVVVLPAEFGVDPTGIGRRIGLTAMSDADETGPSDAADAAALAAVPPAAPGSVSVFDAVWRADTPFRSDEMTLTLTPNEGGEIKALMQAGQRLMFSWVADGGAVNFDMHGEALDAAKDEFTSYWKGRAASSGNGAFVAPFAGTHGWYWRNRGTAPVTVRVRTSGYYEKLFRP